jgi:hypothetical protein
MAWHCRLLFIFSIQRFDEYKLRKCEECIGAFKNVQKEKQFHSLDERSAGTWMLAKWMHSERNGKKTSPKKCGFITLNDDDRDEDSNNQYCLARLCIPMTSIQEEYPQVVVVRAPRRGLKRGLWFLTSERAQATVPLLLYR